MNGKSDSGLFLLRVSRCMARGRVNRFEAGRFNVSIPVSFHRSGVGGGG